MSIEFKDRGKSILAYGMAKEANKIFDHAPIEDVFVAIALLLATALKHVPEGDREAITENEFSPLLDAILESMDAFAPDWQPESAKAPRQ